MQYMYVCYRQTIFGSTVRCFDQLWYISLQSNVSHIGKLPSHSDLRLLFQAMSDKKATEKCFSSGEVSCSIVNPNPNLVSGYTLPRRPSLTTISWSPCGNFVEAVLCTLNRRRPCTHIEIFDSAPDQHREATTSKMIGFPLKNYET